jgi:GT2 family glycosyltransferase
MIKSKIVKKSDISIILLLYNTPKEKLKNLSIYEDFDVYILDQSNDIATKKKILKLLPRIKYYKVTNINRGFAKGINHLIKKINTKFFLCTQPDVLIKKQSIIKLLHSFNKYKDCIISIPNLNKKTKKKISKKEIIKVEDFIGAIFLANKYKFNQIGKFDENFFFYWEDVDLSKRINDLKIFNIYRCNNVVAFHNNGKSTINNAKSNFIRTANFKFGEYYFDYKHQKLRVIKLIREFMKRIILLFVYLIFFNYEKLNNNLYNIIGILKFYFFLLKKFITLFKRAVYPQRNLPF